jgi:putative flavoprotein involved in K+ transport
MPLVPPASRAPLVARAVAPVLAVLCIVSLDGLATARSWPIPVIGLLDEPAHLLTAWLVLNAVGTAHLRPWRWVLLGAVAIDIDHIPLYLWGGPVPVDGGRPVTHSLITVLVLLAVGGGTRRARAVLVGLAFGVLTHLVRDVATGPGVPALWPVRQESVLLPYRVYLLLLVGLAAIAVVRQLRPGHRDFQHVRRRPSAATRRPHPDTTSATRPGNASCDADDDPPTADTAYSPRMAAVPPPDHEQPLDVLVIGAGQAGLGLAWHLRRSGLRFVVVDAADRVGHAWRSRWDSLRLFSSAQYDSLPGLPFPALPGTYPTKDEVADYLETYAQTLRLPVRLGTRVTRLCRSAEGFTAETTNGTLTARQVVVATGAFISPHVPSELAGGLEQKVVQVHSAEYRSPADLPDGPVLVVGAGNSGVQIAAELASSGHQVSLAVGTRPRMVPQRPLGLDLFWWLTTLGLATRPSGSGPARPPRLRERVIGNAWPRVSGAILRPRAAASSTTSVGFVIGTTWRRLRADGVSLRPRAVTASGATVGFADGTTLDVGAVVWATGFHPDYPWLDVPGVIVDGKVQHTGGSSAVPGLFFLGLPWQRSRSSDWLGFVAEDAAFLAEHLQPRDP